MKNYAREQAEFFITFHTGSFLIRIPLQKFILRHTGYELMKRKRAFEKAVRTTISMPPDLLKKAMAEQQHLLLPTFSDYIQSLIRATPGALR